MILPFDIFQTGADGSVCWMTAAASLEDAASRLKAMAVSSTNEVYVILNQQTGQKFIVKLDGAAAVLVPAVSGASAPQQLGKSE